ncbi:hypothetical protein D3Z48_04265 [Clostridiaceae bacterium]|nr:hypothetical protein [Clostridiaceae bacterium]
MGILLDFRLNEAQNGQIDRYSSGTAEDLVFRNGIGIWRAHKIALDFLWQIYYNSIIKRTQKWKHLLFRRYG